MIPDRLPTNWPDICRSVGIERIHVDPGWQSNQRARLDRRFTPIGVAWHHDGIPPGHRSIERWVNEHTVGGRWGTTTYINCIWPDGTLIIHGCRWSVNTGLSVPAVVRLVRNGQPVPPYPHGPRGISSTNTNDEFYGVVLHGGTRDGSSLADTFTDAQMATAARLTWAFTAIGVPAHSHVEHRQLSPDRKPDPYWGSANIATTAAAQAIQPPLQGDDDMTPEEHEMLRNVASVLYGQNLGLDGLSQADGMDHVPDIRLARGIAERLAAVERKLDNLIARGAGGGPSARAIAREVANETARRMEG